VKDNETVGSTVIWKQILGLEKSFLLLPLDRKHIDSSSSSFAATALKRLPAQTEERRCADSWTVEKRM